MFDFKKIREDFTKHLHSYSADDLQECIDEYNQLMALADLNKAASKTTTPQRKNSKPQLNGVSMNAEMPHNIIVRPRKKKPVDMVTV